jgi:hypothetical protein
MLLKPVRVAFLIGLVTAVAASPARAQDPKPGTPEPGKPATKVAPVAADPCVQTIQVIECVPENYTTTRTAYRYECRQEACTAYRCEFANEVRTRTCTTYDRIPEVRNEVRTVCTMVPTVETRTVCRPHWSYVTETRMVCKTVDRGHYECREVHSCFDGLRNRMRRHHGNDCCNPCCCECAPVRTRQVWVPCRVTVQCPVTCCRKVCTYEQVKCNVTVCRPVSKQVTVQVCSYRCVPKTHTETYNVCVRRLVPYQTTRTVRVCVPYQETVNCCRMVSRVVTRTVPAPVANACGDGCGNNCCNTCCCESRGHRRLFGGHNRGCRSSCCSTSSCGGCCN